MVKQDYFIDLFLHGTKNKVQSVLPLKLCTSQIIQLQLLLTNFLPNEWFTNNVSMGVFQHFLKRRKF